ncbi:Rbbp9 [Symbiodinium sp. CCMP2592]|nr:Rbbp9 [Symbiodinium sp. CCMP2592]
MSGATRAAFTPTAGLLASFSSAGEIRAMKWPACWLAAWLLSAAQETEQKSKYQDDHASAIKARLQVWASTWEESSTGRSALLRTIRQHMAAVSFDVASTYASWAAELPNSAGNYAVAAAVSESVALLPHCLSELKSKSELQSRCPQKMYKIAIQKLFSMGDADGAELVWKHARQLFRGSTRAFPEMLPEEEAAIPWPSALQTPTVWVRGLREKPFWDCYQAWPFVRTLEAQAVRILSEAIDVAPKLTRAYPYLFTQGSWQNLFIFRGRTWNTEVCDVMPRTCQLLVPEIPTKPGLPTVVPNNEEIVLFRSMDGAYVGPHSGAVNNQINIHLTLKGGQGAFLNVAGDRRELKAGKAMCFQDSYLHSLEHTCQSGSDDCSERLSLVVRVLHPDYDVGSLRSGGPGQLATEAEGPLEAYSETTALRAELSRLREQYRKLSDSEDLGEEPCKAPVPTDAEVKIAHKLFTFLSQEFHGWSDVEEPIDAIVVLSNWYDRLSKVRKVLELAAKARSVPIVVVGGRGRLSSIRAAELDGEAHATLARLLVLLEVPGELGTLGTQTNRVVAISCNECPTPELRAKCGCVGNTGFNTDRFLEWAATYLPPSLARRPRRVVIVEESYLVRRVTATVLGRLSGMTGTPRHVHNHSTMQVSIVNARETSPLDQLLQVHESMPSAMMQLMADEVARLENYSSQDAGSPRLFSKAMFLGDVQAAVSGDGDTEASAETISEAEFRHVWGLGKELSAKYATSMEKVARDRRLFWRCVAPRDSEGMATWTVPEAPGEAWGFWRKADDCESGK